MVPAPQIHFTQSTPPFLSCIPVSCEKSVFLKMGSSNAWVPEVLPSTLCMGAVVHRAYLFTGEIAILSVGKALGLEAGTRCSGPASQPFTDHFGHSLVLPRPVFLCKSKNPDSFLRDSEASSSRECSTFRTIKMSFYYLRWWVTTRDRGKPVLRSSASHMRIMGSGGQQNIVCA